MQVWSRELRNVDHWFSINIITKIFRLFSLAIRIKNNIYYGQPNIQIYLPDWTSKKNYTVNSRYLERQQGTNKFVQVVILCKLIRMGPIVLFETSRVRLIDYSRYQDLTVYRILSNIAALFIKPASLINPPFFR